MQIPTLRGVMCTVGVQILKKSACTQTLFHFSFRSFGKHERSGERGEHASEASEHPFALAVNKFPAVYFLSRALEGL